MVIEISQSALDAWCQHLFHAHEYDMTIRPLTELNLNLASGNFLAFHQRDVTDRSKFPANYKSIICIAVVCSVVETTQST